MTDLSILIPSRNEMFLARTIQDILEHAETDIEVIAVLDGQWAEPPIPDHERVVLVYHSESIGQRAATNEAARLARGKYVAKCDAHCSFDQGFDRILLADMQDDWTCVPTMKNLHAFDWVCEEGHRRYQGPSGPCLVCGKPTTRDILWRAKPSPNSNSYRFDKTLHFQYWKEFEKRPEGKGDITPSLSLQGSFFLCTREKYFELGLCDEAAGSWGQQGVEVACKTWLSGGKVMVNKKTWYAHMFRTQGGDFSFPYPNPGIEKARQYSRDMWFNDKWPKAIHKLPWLIDKFAPVPDWDLTKGFVYYTDNQIEPDIMEACQRQIMRGVGARRLVSVSLGKPVAIGDNITVDWERGYLTMYKQMLAGIEALDTDIVFFVEHDWLYHPTHFDFVPPRKDIFYYNNNVWKVDATTGHALHYEAQCTSALCAYRELLLEHYRERVKRTEEAFQRYGGNTEEYRRFIRRQGFEPGTHNRPERVDNHKAESWTGEYGNIDIRHGKNLTPTRWRKDQFRNQKYTAGWVESDRVPGWGITKGRFAEILKEARDGNHTSV